MCHINIFKFSLSLSERFISPIAVGTFLFLFIASLCSFNAFSQITATQVGMVDFQVQQNLTADDMNGTNDVTAKLQEAVTFSRNNFKTLFIPSGTYKVSGTIDCTVKLSGVSHSDGQGAVIIVGSAKKRPIIKLADNSPVFKGTGLPNQSNGPNAIFELHSDAFPSKKSDWIYYSGIRSIDFDLGSGNPGAVAISWASAQNCFLEDIDINATGAWGGIAGLPGGNALTANIKINGGKYGIYFTRNEDTVTLWGHASSTTIVGCQLINQTENAVRINGWGGVTLVGMEIKKENGTAIYLKGSSNPNDCPLAIVDSQVEFSQTNLSNTAIDNSGKSTLSLINVYALNCPKISFNNNDENLLPSGSDGNWTHVIRYHYIDKNPKSVSSKTLAGNHFINGNLTNKAVVEVDNTTPPQNLITKHIWPFTPTFEDEDVYLVKPSGTNDRELIQGAINSNEKVMLAAGNYLLDGPIVLKSNTILFGCPGMWSVLKEKSNWVPNSPVWFIETENSASATTYLMEIGTDPDIYKPYWGGVHWQAGKESVVRNCAFSRTSGSTGEFNLQRVKISGNGGGRWYNYSDHKNLWDNPKEVNENHRKVLITGTNQPLTFYGLNLERGGGYKGVTSSFPMCEIENSANVRIFGAKTETYQPYARLNNCKNIQLVNIQDWGIHNQYLTSQNYIEIEGEDCKDIEICNAQWNKPPNSSFKIVEDPWYNNEPDRNMHLGLYRKGSFNSSNFETSGTTSTSSLFNTDTPARLNVFPNPTQNGKFTIFSEGPIGQIQVYNLSGQMVLCQNLDEKTGFVELKQTGVFLLKSNDSNIKLVVQ